MIWIFMLMLKGINQNESRDFEDIRKGVKNESRHK